MKKLICLNIKTKIPTNGSNFQNFKMKYVVAALITLYALIGIGCGFEDNVETTVTQLPEKKGHPAIYIKKIAWGLTGDRRIVLISNNSAEKFSPRPSSEYVYDGLFTMFYKFERDTVFVYTPIIVDVPVNFKATYPIVQKQLSNPEMMDLLDNRNYEKDNLIKL